MLLKSSGNIVLLCLQDLLKGYNIAKGDASNIECFWVLHKMNAMLLGTFDF